MPAKTPPSGTAAGLNLATLPPGAMQQTLQQRFAELSTKWKKETGHLSNVTKKCTHPAYQQIIGMGPDAVLLILKDLKESKADWFWALTAITGENPISEEIAGNIKKMTEAWLQWGRMRGYGV